MYYKYNSCGRDTLTLGKKIIPYVSLEMFSLLDTQAKVIGQISIKDLKKSKTVTLNNDKKNILMFNEEKYLIRKTTKLGIKKVVGYLEVVSPQGEKEYVALVNATKLLTVIPSPLIVVAAIILGGTGTVMAYNAIILPVIERLTEHKETNDSDVSTNAGVIISENDNTMGYSSLMSDNNNETETIPEQESFITDGIIYEGDYLTVTKNDYIPLGNPPENKGYCFVFTVIDENGNEVFKTGKIAANKGVQWFPSQCLSVGKHSITIVIDIYDEETNTENGQREGYLGTDLLIDLDVLESDIITE